MEKETMESKMDARGILVVALAVLVTACAGEIEPSDPSATATDEDGPTGDGKEDSFADTTGESAETYYARFLYAVDTATAGWYYVLGTWDNIPLPGHAGEFIDLAIYLTDDHRYWAEYAELQQIDPWTQEGTGRTLVQGSWQIAGDTLVLTGLGTGARAGYAVEGETTEVPGVAFTLTADVITAGAVGAAGMLVRVHTTGSLEALVTTYTP
jgi:hypothetical protein